MTDKELDERLRELCKRELYSLEDKTCFRAEVLKDAIKKYDKIIEAY